MSEISKIKAAFKSQLRNAKQRGIGFNLTFEQWLDWWGDDLPNRGVKAWNLQMQRFHDKGAYELGNIRKGTPAANQKTAANCRRTKRAATAAIRLDEQRATNPSAPSPDFDGAEDNAELDSMFKISSSRDFTYSP